MEWWMYLVIVGMLVLAAIPTVWITLWTVQRGERNRAAREEQARSQPADGSPPSRD